MDNQHIYAVILAGGEGARFAPLSTPDQPKQFLKIIDPEKSLIVQTFDRISEFAPPKNIYVSTANRYSFLVSDHLPQIPMDQVIAEPLKKNTAAPMALLTRIIFEKDPESVVFFFPSDHYIRFPQKACHVFFRAARLAFKNESFIIFGVPPDFPSPDYGYIERDEKKQSDEAFGVLSFREKPDIPTAQKYLSTGNYYWNSGIFCWSSRFFLQSLGKYVPTLERELGKLKIEKNTSFAPTALQHYFEAAESISIDYALMEKTSDAVVIPFHAGWSDVGTWKGLADLAKKYSLSLPPEIVKYMET